MVNDISTYYLYFMICRDRCVGTLLQAIKLSDTYANMFGKILLFKQNGDKRVYVGTCLGNYMFVDDKNNTYNVDENFTKLTKIENRDGHVSTVIHETS